MIRTRSTHPKPGSTIIGDAALLASLDQAHASAFLGGLDVTTTGQVTFSAGGGGNSGGSVTALCARVQATVGSIPAGSSVGRLMSARHTALTAA